MERLVPNNIGIRISNFGIEALTVLVTMVAFRAGSSRIRESPD